MATSPRPIPGTPRIIAPSPEISSGDEYFPPVTRSATRQSSKPNPPPIPEDESGSGSDVDLRRARSRSRSRDAALRRRRMSGLTSKDAKSQMPDSIPPVPSLPKDRVNPTATRRKLLEEPLGNGIVNGHLSPVSAAKYYWRELSRSPSPLGLIPIHREWRHFIHRHEVPRKALHVSIGFVAIALYAKGYQRDDIHPTLLYLLVPITLTDVLRHNWPSFNQFYIRVLGAFMRETEAHDKYNGVIWYLLGAWTVLRFCPKDIATVSILLLSWCDTAASTFGRLWGRYTPRIRRGKSLAGTIAAAVFGVAAAALFWGFVGPKCEELGWVDNSGEHAFAFQGRLGLPPTIRKLIGWTAQEGSISGGLALGVVSVWAGIVASASEAADMFGLDDNLTLPVLASIGLYGFLRVFAWR